MNRIKQHFWLTGILFFLSLKANATDLTKYSNPDAFLNDSVRLHLLSATGNVGDIITIPLKVGSFNDISQLSFSINWSSSFLDFQSVNAFGFSSINMSHFDISNAASGRFTFNWTPPTSQSALDSTVLFNINFRIKSYSGLPIPVFMLNPMVVTGGINGKTAMKSGSVYVINNGGCAGRSAGITCATAPLLCIGDFPYCNTLPPSNPFTQSFGCGSIENYHFIQYEAATPEITFRVQTSSCDGGLLGNGDGVQIRIYETSDCIQFKLKYCRSAQPIGRGASDTINVRELTVGGRYFLMIDGQRGDICDYTISIEEGTIGGKPQISASQISGINEVCKNTLNVNYSIPNQKDAVAYIWKTDKAGTITSGQGTPSVRVNWGTVADSICVKVIGNCFESDWACKGVNLAPPVENNVTAYFCTGTSYTIAGRTFSQAGSHQITLPNASFRGCDSIINLTLIAIDLQVSASKTRDLSCENKDVLLNGSATVTPNTATVIYEWIDASNTVIGSTSSKTVNQAGTYRLVVRATLDGVGCEKSTSVVVTQSGNVPPRPELQGDVITCVGKTVNYNIVNAPLGILKHNWFLTNGTITTGASTPSVSVNWGTSSTGKVCVSAENGCGTSDTTCLSVEINKVPNTATITGSQSVCPGATSSYNLAQSFGTINYQWKVPTGATIKKGQGTATIEVDWGTSLGGQVCVLPSNSCGAGNESCFDVEIKNSQPDSIAITGLTSVCPGETASLSVVPDAAVTEYVWSVPTNATIISGQGTPSVSIRYNSGQEVVAALVIKNSCGLTRRMTKKVTLKNELPPLLSVVGTFLVCSNDTTTFSVNGTASITAYKWFAPTGASIISGQGTSSIRIVWGAATGGNIQLELTNACNLKRTVNSSNVIIKNSDLPKPTIIGNNTNCPNSKSTYSVTANAAYKSYKWSIPSNATLVSGQGTNSVEVLWNTTGANDICLTVENECAIKSIACMTVSVKTGIDSLEITGLREVCAGETAQYTAERDPDAVSYFWVVPSGATILSGRGTTSIVVRFGSNGGNIVVQPIGGCAAERSTFTVAIKSPPTASSGVTGKNNLCVGDTATYTAEPVVGVRRYNWRVATGGTIIGNDSTNVITVRWAAGFGGAVAVKTQNECTESTETSMTVTVNQIPQPRAGADDSTCGRSYILRGGLSLGLGKWSVLDKPQNASVTLTDATNPTSSIKVSHSGKYTFVIEETNSTCKATDTVSVFFREHPQLTLVSDDCSPSGIDYTVKVAINKGNAPFTFLGGLNGSIQGNLFTSNPVLDGDSFTFWVTDATGCVSDTVKGQKICPCITTAAVLRVENTLSVCYGAIAKISVQQAPILDGNDGFEFVLHNGTATAIGTILQRNKTGEFAFDNIKMQYGQTYFVHQVVGNIENGSVSTVDRCYRVSNGVPVLFKDKIEVGLQGDTIICNNTSANLIFKTSDKGSFSIQYSNLTQNQNYSGVNVRNNSLLNVSPAVNSSFALIRVTDASGCLAQIKDTVIVRIRQQQTANAGEDKTVCDKNAQLAAILPPQYGVVWRSLSGAQINNSRNATTAVSQLKNGKNTFVMIARDSLCPTYQIFDSVSIFLPILPKAINLSLEMESGDTLKSKIGEEAPVGTYSITLLDSPQEGRFDLFSGGSFSYISKSNFSGVIRFRYMLCSDACTNMCDTGEVRILVKPKIEIPKEVKIDMPNAITPNDDGKNDALVIDNLDKYPANELIIFNRWGDILFKAKPYTNDWNGTNQKGDPLPEGTYYYVLRLNINDGKILRGDITVLR